MSSPSRPLEIRSKCHVDHLPGGVMLYLPFVFPHPDLVKPWAVHLSFEKRGECNHCVTHFTICTKNARLHVKTDRNAFGTFSVIPLSPYGDGRSSMTVKDVVRPDLPSLLLRELNELANRCGHPEIYMCVGPKIEEALRGLSSAASATTHAISYAAMVKRS